SMTPYQAQKFQYNILDFTKVWPYTKLPLCLVGNFVLDKNTVKYFAEIEQVDGQKSYQTLIIMQILGCFIAFSPCDIHLAICPSCSSIASILILRYSQVSPFDDFQC
ncbi:hypothetical protein F5051DRAFT_336406, partial [Lentinula edodes]